MSSEIIPSSIIQFSVANFGCFRDRVDFSMAGRKDGKNTFLLHQTGDQLFTAAIIYGPNASGKSTLIEALYFMKAKIKHSIVSEHIEKTIFSPFLMEEGFSKKPSFFEIVFVVNTKVYRYNFSILKDHTIVEENLYEVKKISDDCLFARKKNEFDVSSKFTKDKVIEKRTTKTALFISVASQWNVAIAQEINMFFMFAISAVLGFDTERYGSYSARLAKDNMQHKERVLDYFKRVDFCISNFRIEEKEMLHGKDISFKSKTKKLITAYFSHPKFKLEKEIGEQELNIGDESKGTKTFFEMLGPVIDTLESGKILFVDELNSSLHFLLCQFIVNLFHSKKTNPHNAQLIFTTHDLMLLSDKSIDRDQFWFTERDRYGAAKLFSLAEFKDRKDSSGFQVRYLNGRYGALPFIDDSFLKD